MDPKVMNTDTQALNYKSPGGMLSNLISQLKAQNAIEKLDEVLLETPRVREDLGYPPLVTPMSQMVGVQATSNVLTGRYKNISKEIKAYVKGEYGRAPGEISEELRQLCLNGEEPITCRYADLLEPTVEKARKELGDRATSDEDVLSYIAFPQLAENFFAAREERRTKTFAYTIREIGEDKA